MARMTVTGLDNFSVMIQALGDSGREVMKAAVYAGAGEMAAALKEEIRKLPEEEGYLPNGSQRAVLTAAEKQALLDHVGISKLDDDGGRVSAAVGFNGYTEHATKKYPQGVPVPLIARSIESGSSVRKKRPFMRQAANAARERVQKAMLEAANTYLQTLAKE